MSVKTRPKERLLVNIVVVIVQGTDKAGLDNPVDAGQAQCLLCCNGPDLLVEALEYINIEMQNCYLGARLETKTDQRGKKLLDIDKNK